MTRAPTNLLAVRSLLLAHLDVDPNTDRPADLEPAEVGIIGDPAHRGGYHCGSDRVVTNDYSVVESSRDRNGLTLDAAALDVGGFEVRSGGRTHTLPSFSIWCVGQCAADATDTRDIREIIYSPDGTTVKRWDRLGKRTSGDSSHRWHTHVSFFRDAIKAGRDQRPLFRRYLTSIGLIEGDDDMDMTAEERQALIQDIAAGVLNAQLGRSGPSLGNAVQTTYVQVAKLAAATGQDPTNAQAIVAGVLAELSPERIAAAIPSSMAKEVADELARRLVA
ncbi:hypothetical protein ACGFIE_22500 [Micromonospora sp. NPDC049275]|uniref:hypothetical protein n=1 Tax=Micromonospora sp. NPDC049275 TaxID=3364268 RepID=UPI00371BB538